MSPDPATGGHVVVATDKFKGSLTAVEVATHLARGLEAGSPGTSVRRVPVADGGEGTVEAALSSGYAAVPVTVSDALGTPIPAVVAVRGEAAVVELAQASGLQQLDATALRPLAASSAGTGELVRAALDAGCRTVVLGLGGSACTDGGAGLARALGARLLGADGAELPPGGGPLAGLDRLDLSGLDPRLADTTVVLASDVDHPLLGPDGAAAVFAQQKGATPAQVAQLEAGLTRWSEVVAATVGRDHATRPGAGAAGGVGFGAMALLGAEPRPGVDLLLEMLGFVDVVAGARLVITGEGSLDRQSLGGKAPVGVARAAGALGVPTVAVAGVTALEPAALSAAGFARTYTLHEIEPDLRRCLTEAGPLLERVGRQIAADFLSDTHPDRVVSGGSRQSDTHH